MLNNKNKLQLFVIWLDGFLASTGDNLDTEKTLILKNKLNSLFEHEAELLSDNKEITNQQSVFLRPNDGNPNELYRC